MAGDTKGMDQYRSRLDRATYNLSRPLERGHEARASSAGGGTVLKIHPNLIWRAAFCYIHTTTLFILMMSLPGCTELF